MGRNRKNGTTAWLVPGVKAAALCLLLGGSAIGYVYQKNQLIELGRQTQRCEHQLQARCEKNDRVEKQLRTLQSPKWLDDRVKELKLGLVQPVQSQIMTIIEVPATAAPLSQPPSVEKPMGRIALK